MPLKASREVWSMGVEEVGEDGSNNPIEYTGETSRPSAAHDGNAAAIQIAAITARIIFVFMFLAFLVLPFKIIDLAMEDGIMIAHPPLICHPPTTAKLLTECLFYLTNWGGLDTAVENV